MISNKYQFKFLNYLNSENPELFENKKTQLTYHKGETIIKKGALATNVIFVTNGLVKKFIQSDGQKLINLRLVTGGDFMAFFTIFGNTVYPFTAVALKDTTICMIDKSALTKFMLSSPHYALEMTTGNYHSENRYLELIESLSFKQMRGKLASTLLYLSSEHFFEEDVFSYLSRQDIADFAAITIESAIKFIKEFEKENILELENKKIVITNKDKLNEISRIG